MSTKDVLSSLLKQADIIIGGTRPWDVQVHNEDLYGRVMRQGTLGAGEAYMDGWWDCEALDVMFYKAICGQLGNRFSGKNLPAYFLKIYQTFFNLQNRKRAFDVGKKHYDFDNAMFERMLGPTMNYSCGYWRNADNLDDAQTAKMDLICRKLDLKPGQQVLDIGCGWGALARFMQQNYNVEVTGISVSSEQIEYAKNADKSGKINWIFNDYRELQGNFDRIVSVGMFEHVGYKNYKSFMREVRRLLKDDGIFLLHTIGSNAQRKGTDPWIDKYIFPNGMLPAEVNLTEAFNDLFIMEDWQNFGADYDKTLMAWSKAFDEGYKAGDFSCDERARRMFQYYLQSCAGSFRARDMQLWQIVLSPHGVPGGYQSVR